MFWIDGHIGHLRLVKVNKKLSARVPRISRFALQMQIIRHLSAGGLVICRLKWAETILQGSLASVVHIGGARIWGILPTASIV